MDVTDLKEELLLLRKENAELRRTDSAETEGQGEIMTEQRRITDELRSGVANYPFRDNRDFALFEDIADRIDAAHEEALREAYTKGREEGINASYVPADEWLAKHPYTLAELGWRQAVDADNKPIHIGSLAKYNGSVGKVTQIAYTIAAVIVTTDKWVTWKLNEVHVVDTLTVEDVLEELLHEYDRDDSELTNGEIIGRFAAKLQLAGDAE